MDMKVDKNGQQIEVEADGKQEIVPAGEPLKKKPMKKIRKSAAERWDELRKKLDSATAIMPIADDEEEQDDDQPAENSDQGDSESEQPQEGGEELSPDEAQELAQHAGGDGEEQPQEGEEDGELEEALRDHGLSDAEIAHVIHGHQQPIPDPKQEKAKSEALSGQIEAQNMQTDKDQERKLKEEDARTDIEHKKKLHELELKEAAERSGVNSLDKDHKKRMLDLEYQGAKEGSGGGKHEAEHKRRMMDLEYENAKGGAGGGKEEAEHKKKMLALEYETAKQEKQLELEFRKKEHALKLKQMEEAAKQAMKHKSVESEMKHKQKLVDQKQAATDRKKLKKSEDDEDYYDLSDDEILELSSEFEFEDELEKMSPRIPGSAPVMAADIKAPTPKLKEPVSKLKDVNRIPTGKPAAGLGIGWSMNAKSGAFDHSTHGNIATTKTPEGLYQVHHGGRSVGRFKSLQEAGAKIKSYVNELGPGDTGMHNVDASKMKS